MPYRWARRQGEAFGAPRLDVEGQPAPLAHQVVVVGPDLGVVPGGAVGQPDLADLPHATSSLSVLYTVARLTSGTHPAGPGVHLLGAEVHVLARGAPSTTARRCGVMRQPRGPPAARSGAPITRQPAALLDALGHPLAELGVGRPEVGDAPLDDAVADLAGGHRPEAAGDVVDQPVPGRRPAAAGRDPRPG